MSTLSLFFYIKFCNNNTRSYLSPVLTLPASLVCQQTAMPGDVNGKQATFCNGSRTDQTQQVWSSLTLTTWSPLVGQLATAFTWSLCSPTI